MVKIYSKRFFPMIKIICVVAIVFLMLGFYPFHIIPSANIRYMPDGTFEWKNVEVIQIDEKNEISQEFRPQRVTKIETISIVIESIMEPDNSTLSISVQGMEQHTEGIITNIDLSKIECRKRQVFPVKTPKLDKNETCSLSIKVTGNATVQVYFVDVNAENYFGKTYIDGEEYAGKLLAELHTTEYASRDIGIYVWLIGILFVAIIVIPWKKTGFFYLRFFIIADGSLLFLVMSYYQKVCQENRDISELKKLYLGFAVIAMLVLFIHAYIYTKKMRKRVEKCFVVSVIGWGIIYLLLMPPYSYPDEPTHYAQANAYVNKIMGHEVRDETGQIYLRTEELIDVVSFPDSETLTNYYDGCFAGNVKSGYGTMNIVNGKGLSRASIVCYIPFEIGILLARVMELNYVWSFTLSNIIGLICYTVIIYIAICLMPMGKWILFLIAQFPLALSLATSFTYDLINYSFLTLFFALFCREIYNETQITWKRMLTFIILGIIVFPIKYAYFPFTLFIVLIPGKKFNCTHTGIIKAVLVTLCLVATFSDKTVMSHMMRSESVQEKKVSQAEIFDVRGLYEVKEGSWYSKDEIIGDKGNLFKYTYNTFFKHLDYYWNGMIGMRIGWGDSFIPDYVYNIWWILILFAIIGSREESVILCRNIRIGIFIICALSFAAVYLAMLLFSTPVGYTDCPSVGARYILPLLFPVCIALRGNKVTIAGGVSDELFVLGADICQILGVVYMFSGYLAR